MAAESHKLTARNCFYSPCAAEQHGDWILGRWFGRVVVVLVLVVLVWPSVTFFGGHTQFSCSNIEACWSPENLVHIQHFHGKTIRPNNNVKCILWPWLGMCPLFTFSLALFTLYFIKKSQNYSNWIRNVRSGCGAVWCRQGRSSFLWIHLLNMLRGHIEASTVALSKR